MATSNAAPSSTLREVKQMSEKLVAEARPRMREAIDQVSDWLDQGNNRIYGVVALAAMTGLAGFLIGRAFPPSSAE